MPDLMRISELLKTNGKHLHCLRNCLPSRRAASFSLELRWFSAAKRRHDVATGASPWGRTTAKTPRRGDMSPSNGKQLPTRRNCLPSRALAPELKETSPAFADEFPTVSSDPPQPPRLTCNFPRRRYLHRLVGMRPGTGGPASPVSRQPAHP